MGSRRTISACRSRDPTSRTPTVIERVARDAFVHSGSHGPHRPVCPCPFFPSRPIGSSYSTGFRPAVDSAYLLTLALSPAPHSARTSLCCTRIYGRVLLCSRVSLTAGGVGFMWCDTVAHAPYHSLRL